MKKLPEGPTKNIVLLVSKGLNELVKTHIHIKFMTFGRPTKRGKIHKDNFPPSLLFRLSVITQTREIQGDNYGFPRGGHSPTTMWTKFIPILTTQPPSSGQLWTFYILVILLSCDKDGTF